MSVKLQETSLSLAVVTEVVALRLAVAAYNSINSIQRTVCVQERKYGQCRQCKEWALANDSDCHLGNIPNPNPVQR